MSNLLDQAIIEAEALREAALQSAEAAVVDKYSDQIKEAVEQLLEQQEDDLFADEGGLGPEGGEDVSDLLDQVANPSEGDDSLCVCPDEDEEEDKIAEPHGEDVIELDLDKLMESLNEESGEDDEEEIVKFVQTGEELAGDEDSLEESLVVETEPVRDGWGGTPEKIMQHKAKQLLAMLQSDEHKEDFEAINNAVKKLQNENKDLEALLDEKGQELESKHLRVQKLTEAITMMKEILEESNVVNARLLYKVKVLENNSLNERQKSQVAEKLSEAKSVEEAKLIFETLQSSVGSTKRHPESLSEAVERSSSAMLLSRKREATPDGQAPALDRWQRLAGLK
jgi:hypothetical protein